MRMRRRALAPTVRCVSDVPALVELGWADDFAETFAPYAFASVPGRVARVDRGAFDVFVPSGHVRAVAALPVVRAAAADPTATPTTGDWVVVQPPDRAGAHGLMVAVLPRRTAVVRHARGVATAAQVLAANVDVLLLVTASMPAPPLNRVERFLALAWDSRARPVVVLTKTDLTDDVAACVRRVAAAASGVDVVATSAADGTGVADVAAFFGDGVTGALVGASGAGKSTLANALLGDERLVTSHPRADGKGRHTTAWRELVLLPGGGVLLDTPGLRTLQPWDGEGALAMTFADVAELAVDCRFRDCRHDTEPGCAVRAAVDAGLLDPRRVASHAKLLREQIRLVARRDALARIEDRRRWKQLGRQHHR
jgi:ribosome biogenesis GTPase / thiamine phosphate phosphatase